MKKVDFDKSYESYVKQYRNRESKGIVMEQMLSKSEYKTTYNDLRERMISSGNAPDKNMPRLIATEQQTLSYRQVQYTRRYMQAAKQIAREAAARGEATEEMTRILQTSTSTRSIYQNNRDIWAVMNLMFPSYEDEIDQIVYHEE